MSVDFNKTPTDSILNNPTDAPMFGPTPVWERGRKGRGGSRASAVEPLATTAAAPESSAFTRPAAPAAMASEPLSAPLNDPIARNPAFTGDASRTPTAKRAVKSGVAPVAIAAGVIVLAGLAGAGFYAAQPRDQGVAQLTPGSAAPTTATAPMAPTTLAANTTPATPDAATPLAPAPAPIQVASNETRPAPVRKAVTARRAAAPAAARSAGEASADVSATESGAPLDTTNYGADASTPAPVNPAPTAPAAAAPAEVMAPAAAPATTQ